VSLDLAAQEERIQSLADMLSLVAILGGMDKGAIQRVLVSLGSSLLDVHSRQAVDRDLASRLLVQVAKESGERAAIDVASDIHFVATSWKPVLEDSLLSQPDAYRSLPYAEIVFALVNYSGDTLQEYAAFEQFGGADMVLNMYQLSTALQTYPVPNPGLKWDLVGFQDPPDQALVASDDQTYYLLKLASDPTTLRISELERGTESESRREYDIQVSPVLFAAFTAGLLGDMLYWATRLRKHVEPGRDLWERLQALLFPLPTEAASAAAAVSAATHEADTAIHQMEDEPSEDSEQQLSTSDD